jgi:hypothetical protein
MSEQRDRGATAHESSCLSAEKFLSDGRKLRSSATVPEMGLNGWRRELFVPKTNVISQGNAMNGKNASNQCRQSLRIICAAMLPTVGILAALSALLISAGFSRSPKATSSDQFRGDVHNETILGVAHPTLAQVRQHG